MEKALQIQKEVQRILGIDEVYLVGGSVRDLVMGNTPKDYDFCTPMLPEEIEACVEAAGRKVYAIGKKFGTIGFKVPIVPYDVFFDENPSFDKRVPDVIDYSPKYEYVEVTTFRSEVYTNKSRNPEVQFVPSLDEDLKRRDFTMNAMVLKPDGKIYDPFGGKIHIHSKQIKTVGMPKDRIQEDPLRMLRAARFAARYGFDIDPNFIGKARQLADRIYDVSIERWVQELDKLLTSDYANRGIEELEKMGLLQRILPEVNLTYYSRASLSVIGQHSDADNAWKELLEEADIFYVDDYGLSRTMKDKSKAQRYVNTGICHRLKFSNERTKIVLDK